MEIIEQRLAKSIIFLIGASSVIGIFASRDDPFLFNLAIVVTIIMLVLGWFAWRGWRWTRHAISITLLLMYIASIDGGYSYTVIPMEILVAIAVSAALLPPRWIIGIRLASAVMPSDLTQTYAGKYTRYYYVYK